MKDLQRLKQVAEQMLALSVELLGLIDTDEVERARLIEDVKKTPAGKLFSSRALRRWTKTKKGGQPYISQIRR